MASHISMEMLPMIRSARVLLAGLLLALGVVVLPDEPADATTHTVTINKYAYGPRTLGVSQGDTVKWTNQDSVQHDVVVTDGPVSFRSPMLSKGQSWSHTFTKPGTYSYTCGIHPDMSGSVTAKATAKAKSEPADTPSANGSQSESGDGAGAGKEKGASEAEPTASPTAVPAANAVAPTAQQTATLNPFLLLLGASTSVVVFCLLLMASRPQSPPSTPQDAP